MQGVVIGQNKNAQGRAVGPGTHAQCDQQTGFIATELRHIDLRMGNERRLGTHTPRQCQKQEKCESLAQINGPESADPSRIRDFEYSAGAHPSL